MTTKTMNIVYGIPAAIIGISFYVVIAIDHPPIVDVIFRWIAGVGLFISFCLWALVSIKDRFRKFIKGIVK